MENGEKKKEKKKIMKFRRKMEERGQFSGIYVVVLHGLNATTVAIVASPLHASPWSSLLLLVHYSSCVPFIGFLRHCAHKECKSHKHVSKLHAQTKTHIHHKNKCKCKVALMYKHKYHAHKARTHICAHVKSRVHKDILKTHNHNKHAHYH